MSLSLGSAISMGATARSCTISMPIITRLASVLAVPCETRILSVTIVLDSETIAPNQPTR